MNKKSTLRSVANDYLTHPRNERGITLIALIITVIILLILAGTAVSIAINGGDIFSKTADTREKWDIAVERENTAINDVWNILDEMGATPTPEPLPEGWSTTSVARAYPSSSAAQKAPIPKGFVVSSATGENSIATGLVIYKGTEAVTDDNVATAQTSRDQYIWIPVEKNNDGTITWEHKTDDTRDLRYSTSQYVNTSKEIELTLSEDFINMENSVKTYGGFYISRYELGCVLNNEGTAVLESSTSRKGQTVLNAGTKDTSNNYGTGWRSISMVWII